MLHPYRSLASTVAHWPVLLAAAVFGLLECLALDLRMEQGAQQTIKDGIVAAEAARDFVSRDLLQGILDDTEEHIDYLETQLELAQRLGEPNYLQLQAEPAA